MPQGGLRQSRRQSQLSEAKKVQLKSPGRLLKSTELTQRATLIQAQRERAKIFDMQLKN